MLLKLSVIRGFDPNTEEQHILLTTITTLLFSQNDNPCHVVARKTFCLILSMLKPAERKAAKATSVC